MSFDDSLFFFCNQIIKILVRIWPQLISVGIGTRRLLIFFIRDISLPLQFFNTLLSFFISEKLVACHVVIFTVVYDIMAMTIKSSIDNGVRSMLFCFLVCHNVMF